MAGAHPYADLIRSVVNVPGWVFCGFSDPPPAPPGFIVETQRDSFLGFVTHYRFVPAQEAK